MFYRRLLAIVWRHAQFSWGQVLLFMGNVGLSCLLLYGNVYYFVLYAVLIRVLVSYVMLLDNRLYLTMNDMNLLDFHSGTREFMRLFMWQRLVLDGMVYRMLYSVLVVITLLYIGNVEALLMLVMLQVALIGLEYLYFIKRSWLSERFVIGKIMGEVALIIGVFISIVISPSWRLWSARHLRELLWVGMFMYGLVNATVFRYGVLQRTTSRSVLTALHGKIHSLYYKELRLFAHYFLWNSALLVGYTLFFYMGEQQFQETIFVYMKLWLVLNVKVFTAKKEGKMINLTHDSWLLSPNLLAQDVRMVLWYKFKFGLVLSLVVKLCIVAVDMTVWSVFDSRHWIYLIGILGLNFMQEFRLLVVTKKFEVVQLHVIRGIVLAALLLGLYHEYWLVVSLLLLIQGLIEGNVLYNLLGGMRK